MTEWFGPVLGVMRAADLDQALEWQNAVAFGLTAGLHSLDPVEHRHWVDAVEAGNLYVNRPPPARSSVAQPFGGLETLSFGPTAKSGGPNYLIVAAAVAGRPSADEGGRQAPPATGAGGTVTSGGSTSMAGLASESNELRYRPFAPA